MSRMKTITTLFPMVALAVLGLSLPQDASAFGGGGLINLGHTHHGQVLVCELTSTAHGGDGTLTASVNNTTHIATVTLSASAAWNRCALFPDADGDLVPDSSSPDTSWENFGVSLTYEFSAQSAGSSGDSNKGHGQEKKNSTCVNYDVDNPGHGRWASTATYCDGQSSVTCTDNGDGTSTELFSAFCEQSTVVYGTLTWAGTGTAPAWVRDYDDTIGDDCDGSSTPCVLQFGRGSATATGPSWVVDSSGNVDLTACATLFGARTLMLGGVTVSLETGEVVHFSQDFGNSTCSGAGGYIDPDRAALRNCNKESMDPSTSNPPCAPHDNGDGTFSYHASAGATTQAVELADNQWQVNPTIQLSCTLNKDSGVIPSTLPDSSTFLTSRVVTTVGTTPVVSVVGHYAAGQTPLNAYSIITDGSGHQIGLTLNFLSCLSGGNGVAQNICNAYSGSPPSSVALRISGITTSGSEFTGTDLMVNVTGSCASP